MKIQYLGFIPLLMVYVWAILITILSDGDAKIAQTLLVILTAVFCLGGFLWGISG